MEPRQEQLVSLIRRFGDAQIVGAEVGVLHGETSAVLLREFPELTLYMIDPWQPYPQQTADTISRWGAAQHEAAFQKSIKATKFAASRRIILRPVGCSASAPGGLDFAFIDAQHDYDSVSSDFRFSWPQISGGGFIAGHDYDNPGPSTLEVKAAIDDFGAEVNRPVHSGDGYVAWIDKPSRKD